MYGIPLEHVIGSSIRLKYDGHGKNPVLVRLPELEIFDEGEEKPVAIHHFIGRRPILAFGNSDGDIQMLRWVVSGSGPRFAGFIHHPDVEPGQADGACNGNMLSGKSDRALAEATAEGWTIVDVREDRKTIFFVRDILNSGTKRSPSVIRTEKRGAGPGFPFRDHGRL